MAEFSDHCGDSIAGRLGLGQKEWSHPSKRKGKGRGRGRGEKRRERGRELVAPLSVPFICCVALGRILNLSEILVR